MKFKPWHAVVGIIFLPTLVVMCNAFNAPAVKTSALVNKATNTDKMLANYEWFHESSEAFTARAAQINAYKKLKTEEPDLAEKRRLTMELSAMQQVCRELSARYSAKTNEIHVGYLKSNQLPTTLPSEQCE